MKKWIGTLLSLALLLALLPTAAGAAQLSQDELIALMDEIYQAHQEMHTVKTATLGSSTVYKDSSGQTIQGKPATLTYPERTSPPEGVYACLDFWTPIPINGSTDYNTFERSISSMFRIILSAAELLDQGTLINAKLTSGGTVNYYAGARWLAGNRTEDGTMRLILPFMVRNSWSEAIDDRVYVFACTAASDGTHLVLYTDQDFVHEILSAIRPDPLGPDERASFVDTWMDAHEGVEPAEPETKAAETEPPAGSSTPSPTARPSDKQVIGTVTIDPPNTINLRAEGNADSALVGRGAPGETFDCTGIAESGWFEILLPDGQTAYVSPKTSTFTEAL